MGDLSSKVDKGDDPWSQRCKKKTNYRREKDVRSPFDIDMARIIHSSAFRRLQGKTQILGLGDSDFYRTRLTHSIEVAQVSSGIVRFLEEEYKNEPGTVYLPEIPLITAISLAHDIGHPPFGHGGEIALNFSMRNHGGFEGNAQALRIVHEIEPGCESGGLSLTRRTLLGLLKYPAPYGLTAMTGSKQSDPLNRDIDFDGIDVDDWKPPKCYYDEDKEFVDWIFEPLSDKDRSEFVRVDGANKTKYKALDTSIMDVADDISNGIHDLEDAIQMMFLSKEQWEPATKSCFSALDKNWLENNDLTNLRDELFGSPWERKEAIGKLVHIMITNVKYFESRLFDEPQLRYNVHLEPNAKRLLKCLKQVVSDYVIKSARVQTLEYRGLRMVAELFRSMVTNPRRLLPERVREKLSSTKNVHRLVADHIACMTDEIATQSYERLFIPRKGTVFHLL